jgi:hypothetical protein
MTNILGDINTGTGISRWGSLDNETIKYGSQVPWDSDPRKTPLAWPSKQLKITDPTSRQRGRPHINKPVTDWK